MRRLRIYLLASSFSPSPRSRRLSANVSEIVIELDQYSKADTSGPSDSDKDSDYLTGLEDFTESSIKTILSKPEDILLYLNDPFCTSTFIQSILYEDSCAGVAVVDLFVALRAVKDKMDCLSRCNNEIFCRIADLNRETISIKTDYRNLMGNMLAFLDRINGTTNEMSVTKTQEHFLGLLGEEDVKCFNNRYCPCGRKNNQEKSSVDGWTEDEGMKSPYLCSRHQKGVEGLRGDCLGCLLSAFGDRTQSQPPFLNEALLGSFIASLLWLQKGEGSCPSDLSKKIASQGREKTNTMEKSLDLSESNIQMICDICETLCGTPPLSLGPLPSSKRPEPSEEPHGSTYVSRNQNSITQRTPYEENYMILSKSQDSLRSKNDAGSDGESIFEEALTDLVMPPPLIDPPGRHQVTCMGDLSNEMSGKKNVSTFTANSDMESSWVGKLTDDIKTKLRKIKSKTNVTVVERSYVKPHKTLQKLTGALEFAITANTPVGVFDVTVLQYRKRRQSDHPQRKVTRLVEGRGSRERLKRRRLHRGPTEMIGAVEGTSFSNSDSQSDEESSDIGEDEMEEFLDIYVENSNKKYQSLSITRQKATSKMADAKLPISPFFEIQKRYPVFFVQEIVQKTATVSEVQQRQSSRNSFRLQQIDTVGIQQKEMVIQRRSSDLVIYIQVEVEGGQRTSAGGLMVEYQTNSHGTQTRESGAHSSGVGEQKVIKLGEEQQDGQSLYHIWRGYETGSLGETDERERITFEEPTMIGEEEMEEKEEYLEIDEERVLMVKELKEKSVTFSEVLSEIFTEAETQESFPEKREDEWGRATVMDMMSAKLQADIWLPQYSSVILERMEMLIPEWGMQRQLSEEHLLKVVNISNTELEKAMNLVRAIENDVMDVQLSDAIAILPQLESELRKHLQNKMKRIGESEKESSVDNFFSAVDFWPDEEPLSVDSDDSEERLHNIFNLLADLEEAVKSNEYSSHRLSLCEFNSSKIYKLLHALNNSIRQLEETPTVMSLSQTLDIASQLDTAVREYDGIIKKPLEYISPEQEEMMARLKSHSLDDVLVNQHLKSVRKKVFQIVEEEAIDMEGRIERDFDRLDRLERENDEAMKFLEAFLQKTERRAAELNNLKADLRDLASLMSSMYEETVREIREREKHMTEPSSDNSSPTRNEPVKETISGLLIALESLKSRAREKNEACREILLSAGFHQGAESEKSSRRSSRSSFTAKQVETMISTVTDFKKIGRSSLYISWTKPEGSSSVTVMGYEIHVNGTLNHKVRNPARLQAVLYSVDLTKTTEVQLYAVVDSGPKILLASAAHLDV